jgi:anoctamin-10
MVDEIRRVVTESVIPYLTQNKDAIAAKLKKKIETLRKVKETDKSTEEHDHICTLHEIIEEELHELEKDEIEWFDDYLELIMTFGYVTMFASAYPFGATITSLFIYIESK